MTISSNIVSINNKSSYASKDSLCETTCDHCIVRHISMCSVLQEDEIKELSKISSDIIKTSKQTIFSEGDDADYLYNIWEGCVRIIKMLTDGRRQIIGFLFAGDFFGLACNTGYSYSVEAVTNVDLCRIPRTKILQKFHEMPALGQKVFDATRTELQSAQ
jgi:CRP/FNR family transcriptional regulator, anaerobic regulatory protein